MRDACFGCDTRLWRVQGFTLHAEGPLVRLRHFLERTGLTGVMRRLAGAFAPGRAGCAATVVVFLAMYGKTFIDEPRSISSTPVSDRVRVSHSEVFSAG
jgi:hypothetical protein